MTSDSARLAEEYIYLTSAHRVDSIAATQDQANSLRTPTAATAASRSSNSHLMKSMRQSTITVSLSRMLPSRGSKSNLSRSSSAAGSDVGSGPNVSTSGSGANNNGTSTSPSLSVESGNMSPLNPGEEPRRFSYSNFVGGGNFKSGDVSPSNSNGGGGGGGGTPQTQSNSSLKISSASSLSINHHDAGPGPISPSKKSSSKRIVIVEPSSSSSFSNANNNNNNNGGGGGMKSSLDLNVGPTADMDSRRAVNFVDSVNVNDDDDAEAGLLRVTNRPRVSFGNSPLSGPMSGGLDAPCRDGLGSGDGLGSFVDESGKRYSSTGLHHRKRKPPASLSKTRSGLYGRQQSTSIKLARLDQTYVTLVFTALERLYQIQYQSHELAENAMLQLDTARHEAVMLYEQKMVTLQKISKKSPGEVMLNQDGVEMSDQMVDMHNKQADAILERCLITELERMMEVLHHIYVDNLFRSLSTQICSLC
jgi:hypothetical protein